MMVTLSSSDADDRLFVPLCTSPVGGNQAITWGGLTAASQTGGAPYDDYDGGKAIR